MDFELVVWIVLFFASLTYCASIIAYCFHQYWFVWTLATIQLGRKILTADHAWRDKGFQDPIPGINGFSGAVRLPGPFWKVRAVIATHPRDWRIEFTITMGGAMESTDQTQSMKLELRLTWVPAEYVEYIDEDDLPADHRGIPNNMRHLLPPRLNHAGQLKDVIPGVTAMVYMNSGPQQLFWRIFEAARDSSRDFFAQIDVNDFVNLETTPMTVTYAPPRIHGRNVSAYILGTGDPHTPSATCNNGQQFMRYAGFILQRSIDMWLNFYGIDVVRTVVKIETSPGLAKRVVQKAETKEQMKATRRKMAVITKAVNDLVNKGVTPDTAMAVVTSLIQETGNSATSDALVAAALTALKKS